jgi:hypothetical protein
MLPSYDNFADWVKTALKVPGLAIDIGCGVGVWTLKIATAMEEAQDIRDIWGFDCYAPMSLCEKDDEYMYSIMYAYAKMERMEQYLALREQRPFLKLCAGYVEREFPRWLDDYHDPIAFAYFGTGNYQPTMAVMHYLPSRMPVGGVICSGMWDYNPVHWRGETRFFEEWLPTQPNFQMVEPGFIQRVAWDSLPQAA